MPREFGRENAIMLLDRDSPGVPPHASEAPKCAKGRLIEATITQKNCLARLMRDPGFSESESIANMRNLK